MKKSLSKKALWGWGAVAGILLLYAWKSRVAIAQQIIYRNVLDFTSTPEVLRSTFLDFCKNNATDQSCTSLDSASIADLNQFLIQHPGQLGV